MSEKNKIDVKKLSKQLDYILESGFKLELFKNLSAKSIDILFEDYVLKELLDNALDRYKLAKISSQIMDENFRSNKC